MPRPRDRALRSAGLRLHLLDWGAAGLPPILMLHGAAQTAHSFDETAPDLARDHHVLALDQRGHGDSDWAPLYDRDAFAGDIVTVLDTHGWRSVTLVAMSLGGLNAIALAAARPERVRGLVVVDVVPTVAAEGKQAIGRQLAVHAFPTFDAAVKQARAFNPRRTVANIRERLRHAMRKDASGAWVYKFDPAIGGAAGRDPESLWWAVGRLRCPTLLVRGAQSNILTNEGADRFVRTVPGSRVAIVAGAGHSVMGDNPPGFLAAVRPFLARHGL
jgi:pimeloyl-ACP methyl ester carboxylesterase